jgi:hypothetical protein
MHSKDKKKKRVRMCHKIERKFVKLKTKNVRTAKGKMIASVHPPSVSAHAPTGQVAGQKPGSAYQVW